MAGFLIFLEVVKVLCYIAGIAAVLAIFVLGTMFVCEECVEYRKLHPKAPAYQRLPMNEFYLKWRAHRIHVAKAKIRARKETDAWTLYFKTGFHHGFNPEGHLVGRHRVWVATIDGEVKDERH